MRKYILISAFTLVVLIGLIFQLSFMGIKTDQFNNRITEQVKSYNPKLNLNIKDIIIKLNLNEQAINIKTDKSILSIDKNFIKLETININLDLIKLFKGTTLIKNISIDTEQNSIKDIANFINFYKFNIQRFVAFNQIEDGLIKANANVSFEKENKDILSYEIKGKIRDAKINLLNQKNISKIDLNFHIKDKENNFNNISLYYEEIKYQSKKININNDGKNFRVNGDLRNEKGLIKPNLISSIFQFDFDILEEKEISIETENEFSFLINSKRKIEDISLKSEIKFDEIFINKKYQDLIFLKNGTVKTEFSNNDLKVNIDSKYSFLDDNSNNDNDLLNLNIFKKNNQNFEITGVIKNSEKYFNPKDLLNLTSLKFNLLSNKNIKIKSDNKFKFKLDKDLKVKDYNFKSNLEFDKIYFKKNFQDLIYLKNGRISADFNNEIYNLEINSQYSFLNENYNNDKNNILNLLISKDKDIIVNSSFKNNKTKINTKELVKYFDSYQSFIKEQDVTISSDSIVDFLIDNENNIKDLDIKSNLKFDKLKIDFPSEKIKKRVPEYNNEIFLIGKNVSVNHSKNKTQILATGKYALKDQNDQFDNFILDILKENNKTEFVSNLEIKSNSFSIKEIDYKKNNKTISNLMFHATLYDNNFLNFKNINFSEKKNKILLENLHLSKELKVKNIDKIELNYFNNNNKKNNIQIIKNKDAKYELKSISFDGAPLIKNILKGDSKNNFLKIFKNLNSEIELNLDEFYVDSKSYLEKVEGKFVIKNNQIQFADINAILDNKNKFSYKLKTTQKNEKVTNIYIENPEPFIKNYKFIKGFSEGKLYYDSVEKFGLTKSVLEITDFKVKKVPVLAKLLTLADIRGIADLLSGEGIRFKRFEMDYESSGKTTTIKEIYAIGPAISMLMDGYIEKNKLTSLRGTLVPATTINKTISKIPLIGDILVGKKIGEGVFGVSFKIKGPPNNLRTTVNPVKTLTPRFITRTLEQLKRTN